MIQPLTFREREVYGMVVTCAMRQKDIAAVLEVQVDTVHKHLQSIFKKLGTASCLEMAVWHYTRGTV